MATGKPRVHRRLPNPRLVKIHRNYSVEEVAKLLGVHKNTVRNWLRDGLTVLDDRRPALVLGRELSKYLSERRRTSKRPCGLGQLYCVRCREPRHPITGTARYIPSTAGAGCLSGVCSGCRGQIFRRISPAGLERERLYLGLTPPEAQEHINESLEPSVNCDFKQE